MSASPRTLIDKIWDAHVVAPGDGGPSVIYIDLHLVHEVTSPQAFAELRERGIAVRRPERTVATADHSIPTDAGRRLITDPLAARQITALAQNCETAGIRYFGPESRDQGIVHVIGPELGLTQPGMTIVCGDSHTSTHGAFGSLAFGIGTTEVGHVLATQCLMQEKPRTFGVEVDGVLPAGVTAKDLALALIARLGVGGGRGHVLEFTGSTIRALDMEERMTLCNMSIEAGARAGCVASDETTFDYLRGRRFAPAGDAFEARVRDWRQLSTDPGARWDRTTSIDAGELMPMITFGTNPGMSVAIDAPVPDPDAADNSETRASLHEALRYMAVEPGKPLVGQRIDTVFVGSCTNSRITDLRQAAQVLRGRRVSANVRLLVVPGSQAVKRQAEAEGLSDIFRAAGGEWREPGCSMCIALNGDRVASGAYAVSTSNRNFEGRQGKGSRTSLASPATAAATAVTGSITDARALMSS